MSNFNYFHGGEAEQFSFFRIPRALIKNARFHSLSTEAKLLYGLMLDRMGLSLQSGWLDEDNRVFIFYTVHEVEETLSCGHNKAVRLLAELDQFGLIERVKQGQGKPAKIYVKNFTEEDAPEQAEDEKADLKTSEKPTCSLPVSKLRVCPKLCVKSKKRCKTEQKCVQAAAAQPMPSFQQHNADGSGCQGRR